MEVLFGAKVTYGLLISELMDGLIDSRLIDRSMTHGVVTKSTPCQSPQPTTRRIVLIVRHENARACPANTTIAHVLARLRGTFFLYLVMGIGTLDAK